MSSHELSAREGGDDRLRRGGPALTGNAPRVEEASERSRAAARVTILSETSRQLSEAGLELDPVLDAAAYRLVESIGDSAAIFLISPDGERLDPVRIYSGDGDVDEMIRRVMAGRRLRVGESITGRVAATGEAALVPAIDPATVRAGLPQEYEPVLDREAVYAIMAVALRVRGRSIGVVTLARTTPGRTYTEEDLALVQELADRTALAIDNVRLYRAEQAQRARAAVEARARALLEAAPDAIVVADADGRIVLANAQTERWFGYTSVELFGQPVELLVPARLHEAHRRHRTGYLASPRTRPMGAGLELFGRHKAGHEFPVEISLSPIETEAGTLVTAVIRDVTERRRVEQALRASEERFRLAFEGAPIGMALVAPDGRLTRVNRALCALLGYTEVELLGLDLRVIAHPDELDGVDGVDAVGSLPEQVLRGDVPVYVVEQRYLGKDGRVVPTRVTATVVHDDAGGPLYRLVMIEDISAHLEAERLKDEFLGAISHDLQTPVAAIKASAGVVLANAPPAMPADLHRLLANIDQASDQLAALVSDLLEITRAQAGQLSLALERHDLVTLVGRAAQTVEAVVHARDQRLDVGVPPRPVWADVDADRLGRALLNLLSNASKYGRTGGVIALRLEQRDDEAWISVADDGPGVARDEQALIFDRFYRSTASRQHAAGVGLGLAIARAVVELHHGRIWVESEPGQGATFTIALPTSIAFPSPRADSDGAAERTPVTGETRRAGSRPLMVAASVKDAGFKPGTDSLARLARLARRRQRLIEDCTTLRAHAQDLRQQFRHLLEHPREYRGAGWTAALHTWSHDLKTYRQQSQTWAQEVGAWSARWSNLQSNALP